MTRLFGRFLDWLGYKLFGHLDDVDYEIPCAPSAAAAAREWELHEDEQRVIAEATQLCREAATRWTT